MASRNRKRTLTTRLIVVSGVSGSGRASVLRVLEDLGLYCVDNLPVALAPEVVRLAVGNDPGLKGIALGIDPRERIFFPQWPSIMAELEREGLSVADSIRRERLALAEMRERASRVIDTTTLTVHELREIVTAYVMGAQGRREMSVMLVSFGYKYGIPLGLDLMLDARFIPNPFFVPQLRERDGRDPAVREYVLGAPEAQRFLDEVVRLLEFLLPLYHREGKSYLTVGIGCTGGRHRSPALVNALQERLATAGVKTQVSHHDLVRPA